jgi:hypothetical protein
MAQTKTMDWKWIDQALSTALTAAVAAALAWFLGTFRKVDRKTVEEMIAAAVKPVDTRLAQWEARAEKFATQGSIDSLRAEMEKSMGRVEKAIDTLNTQVLELIKQK